MDPKIFKILSEVAAEKDPVKKERLKQRSNDTLAAHFTHPANAGDFHELAYDISNLVWADVANTALLPQIIEVKTVGFADVDYVDEDLRGLRAYWQGPGGQIRSDLIRSERHVLERDEIVASIDIHIDELKTNFWGSFEKLKSQAQAKVASAPVERLIDLIKAGITSGPYYATPALSTLSDTDIDVVLDAVADKTAGNVSLMGTRQAVRKLANVGLDFGDNVKEQILRTGQLGIYKGYPVVQIENFEDFSGNLVLPTDEIWVVGQNAGRLTYYGSSPDSQILQRASFWQRWEMKQTASLSLYGIQKGRIGRIRFT